MTLRVATVLSAREWESRLVAAARSSATVRLVLRAFLPGEVSEQSGSLDVVVVGSETPWATTARLLAWRRDGLSVVGVYPVGDRPAADRLRAAEVDVVLPDDLSAEAMLREIRLIEPAAHRTEGTAPLIAVTGARGAPGRTEVALAVAWNSSGRVPTTLIDADLDAPGLAIRLGIPPRPDLADAVDSVHSDGSLPAGVLHQIGRLAVLPGSHRPGEPSLRPEPIFDVVDAARFSRKVVVDAGPWPANQEVTKAATEAVIVVDGSPLGIVRAATVASEWTGPPPLLVLNRVRMSERTDVVAATRRWTGLEPSAVIPALPSVAKAARSAGIPVRKFRSLLAPLVGTDR
jgi:MinD-like ATPase involved in chromosome partitioning or flagellar assembly